LRRKEAWTPILGQDDYAVETDWEPTMLGVLHRAGKLSSDERRSRMDAWAARWEARLPRAYFGYLWIYGYAAPAKTREDAEAALALLPKYGPLPWYRPGAAADAFVGRTYLLAGRAAEALPMLEYAAKECLAPEDSFSYVAVNAWLGAARQETGDKAGACTAYGEVVRRWGKSASVTAKDARAKMAALGCR
jgi:serine/threonine-protein kinase